MADYLPLFKPGGSLPYTASAAITGGQVLVVSGSGTVAPSAGASVAVVGVAGHDAANGDRVTIHRGGVQRSIAAAAVVAGDQLVSAAAGQVTPVAPVAATVAAADVVATRQIIGLALTAAAAGAAVEWAHGT